ncbi:glycoside hydrolase family 95-like protein [Renibacterium salmoninarum]
MQSTLNTIDVLPAIPAEWPAGSFTGLRARGGFSLDFRWNAGKLTQLKVTSLAGGATTVRYAGLSKTLTLTKGETVMLDGSLKTF